MTRVPVPPEMLRWACERAGYEPEHLEHRIPQLPGWMRVGAMFMTQVILAAKEGRISFREAYDLTGLHGGAFHEYGLYLGFDL